MDDEVAGWIRPTDGEAAPSPDSQRRPVERVAKPVNLPAARKGKKKADPGRLEAVLQGRKASLCVDNISVSFDGFKALNELTLILDEGELRCLIGPNGAGKTTLMDVITGKTRPDEGSVYLVGYPRDLITMTEYEIATLGIGRKFQRPTVFLGHSVFENLELALAGDRSVFRSIFSRLTGPERDIIDHALETVGLKESREKPANILSHGQKQWLEIGMLLVQNPKVLLVDEPVAGMTHQEMDKTAELLTSLAGKRTVVVVEHDMDFVRSIAKQVTVLHEGTVLAEGTLDEVKADPRVVEVYLGDPEC
jgi:urea transport system ATP-binding protein